MRSKPLLAVDSLFLALLIVVMLVFVWLRVYRLPQSLLFFGDLGRDFLVLQDWQKTFKPPLLGPQTSALPINQSAWYFYLLMPFYLLSGQSFYTHNLTLITATLALISVYTYLVWPFKQLRWSLLFCFALLSFHPETVIEQRYIWNPSFVPILILGAAVTVARTYYQKPSRGQLLFLSVLLASAVGLSYATLPVVLVMLLFTHLRIPGHRLFIWLSFLLALGIGLLPTFLFELRHQFLLTNRLLFGEKLSFPDPLLAKLSRLPTLLMGDPNWLIIGGCLIIIGAALIKTTIVQDRLFKDFCLMCLLSLIITLLLPFPLNSHYIFAILTLFFFCLALLPPHYALGLTLILVIYWSKPTRLAEYFQPAPRTVKQTVSCIKNFCTLNPGNYYVTTQSAYHPQHDAKDFEYLFNRYGCQATDITLPKFKSDLMAVIVEDSTYEHNKTAYNELTLLGPAKELSVYTCLPNLRIHTLQKVTP